MSVQDQSAVKAYRRSSALVEYASGAFSDLGTFANLVTGNGLATEITISLKMPGHSEHAGDSERPAYDASRYGMNQTLAELIAVEVQSFMDGIGERVMTTLETENRLNHEDATDEARQFLAEAKP